MISLSEAQAWLQSHWVARPPERVAVAQAAGRTLAIEVELARSPEGPTAAIDGHAVRAADTEGASDYAPLPVAAVSVRQGAPMPPGTDAVLPPPAYDDAARLALAAMARGAHVHSPGHDSPDGARLPAGLVLTPLHLALLNMDPLVRARPRVACHGRSCSRGAMLQALVTTHGGEPTDEDPDLILIDLPPPPPAGLSGDGSPAPEWRPHAHRIAIRPGENTAIGLLDGTPAILLPAHPAEAATVFALLVAPALRRLVGRLDPPPREATLSRKITSSLGQADAVRVRLEAGQAVPLGAAEATGLLAAVAADGFVLVPEGSEGYPAGTLLPIYAA